MKSLALFSSRRAVVSFILVLLVFFIILDVFIAASVRTRMLDDLRNRIYTELDTIGLFVREPLVSHDYARVEQFLLKWAEEDDSIVEMKALMPNDFVLVSYRRPGRSLEVIDLEHRVRFLDRDLMTVILSWDISVHASIIDSLQIKLVAGSTLITVLLGFVLWGTMKKTAFQPLKNELERKNKDETRLREARDLLEDQVRKRTVDLNRSRERLRTVFESAPVSLWIEDVAPVRKRIEDLRAEGIHDIRQYLDAHPEVMEEIAREFIILDTNRASLRLYGAKSREELLGSLDKLFVPESFSAMKEILVAISQGERHIELESRNRTLDGRIIEVLISVEIPPALSDDESALISIVDITERKRMEETLKEREQYLRTIIETEPECVKVIATDGTLVTMNPAGLEMIEADSLEEVAGKSLAGLLSPEYQQKFRALNESVLSGNRENLEFEIRGLRGGRRWLHIHAVPLRNALGDIIGVLGVTKDITEKKKAEDEIRLSEEKFSKAFRSSPTFITISTLDDGVYIDVNDAFLQVSGYTRQELVGHSALELEVWDDRSDRDRMLETLTKQGSVRNMETRLRMKNGQVLTVLYSAERIEIEGRSCILSVKLDITGRKMLENQLLHAQKLEAVGQLAGGVAHDFNNVLTAIISNGYLLKGKLTDNDERAELAERIITLSNNAARVVQELLIFSRKKRGEMSLVHINEIFRGVGTLLGDFMGRGIEIVERYADRHLYVYADRAQLEQVMVNLATNARDAMPRGGRLTIETDLAIIDSEFIRKRGGGNPGMHVLLSVSDSGSGMDSATRERIFEPFFTTKDVGKGTGLGLSIVYGIIQQHRGFLLVDSEPGAGSTFRIFLPLAEPATERF